MVVFNPYTPIDIPFWKLWKVLFQIVSIWLYYVLAKVHSMAMHKSSEIFGVELYSSWRTEAHLLRSWRTVTAYTYIILFTY